MSTWSVAYVSSEATAYTGGEIFTATLPPTKSHHILLQCKSFRAKPLFSWKLDVTCLLLSSWWSHQMETFSVLLAICAGDSVSGKFPAQRPVTRSFDVFFDLRLNERLSKQSRGWSFETTSRPLWRHSNVLLHGPLGHQLQWCQS